MRADAMSGIKMGRIHDPIKTSDRLMVESFHVASRRGTIGLRVQKRRGQEPHFHLIYVRTMKSITVCGVG